MLLVCCPLSLCVRIGQGSKYHLVGAVGFASGVVLFAQFSVTIMRFFEPFIFTGAFSLVEIFRP